jgi:hypothetical protein
VALLTDKMITDELIADVKAFSFLPAVQSQWTHQRILDVAYHEILGRLVGPLTSIDHSFYRESSDITLVADQAAYDIPQYAMLGKIHTAYLVDADGNFGALQGVNPPENVHFNRPTSGHPWSIRIDNNQIVLNPAPSSADVAVWTTLRTFIYRRPGRLVRLTTDGSNTGRAAVVSSVAGGVVTYTDSTPVDFTSSSVHTAFQGTYPFRRVLTAVTAIAKPAATTQTFGAPTAALLSAGYYVCMRGETCVVPVPSHELLLPLQQLMIASMAATQGDKTAYEIAGKRFNEAVSELYPAAANRLTNNMPAMTLYASPFLRSMGRGARMIRE